MGTKKTEETLNTQIRSYSIAISLAFDRPTDKCKKKCYQIVLYFFSAYLNVLLCIEYSNHL